MGSLTKRIIVGTDVLVVPLRSVQRFTDLTTDEVIDVMTSAQTIGRVIEREFEADSLTFTIQVSARCHLLFQKLSFSFLKPDCSPVRLFRTARPLGKRYAL